MELAKKLILFTMDCLEEVAFIGSLFIISWLFLAMPTQVQGMSMEHALHTHDRLILSKVTYKLRHIERGDIIAFHSVTGNNIDLIKRVIGLPGDRIKIQLGKVYINDKELAEPYIIDATNTWTNGFINDGEEYFVPQEMLFVLGDNRPHSLDSREFGPVPISSIIGTAVFRFSPNASFGPLNNPLPPEER